MLNPVVAQGLADAIGDLYADAEAQLLDTIARRVARGLDTPRWAEIQLQEVSRLRAEARGIAARLDVDGTAMIQDAITTAYMRGETSADADIARARRAGVSFSSTGVVDTAAVGALAAETINATRTAQNYILRSTDDAYRRVIADVTGRVVTGAATRQAVTQQALNRLAREGITGFVDKAGRRWQASSYVEMALRTSVGRSMLAGHSDRLASAGYDLVIISSHPNPAPMCQPFEGQILSLSGGTKGTVHTNSALDGSPITVEVFASMAEAEMQGLHHPNCRHSHTLFVPGASTPEVAPYDPQGYLDSQQQRYLERGVRAAKNQQAVAITPEAQTKARARVRSWQARAAEHSERTGIPRRYDRERVQVGDPTAPDVKAQQLARVRN
ncbi:head assembly protein [Gordonia phage Jace]|uniref:Head assembly protein n=1 Tax=Gordonia phage Jace TaxID=2182360 RepID=A0A2U8UJJ5_9CAUD|nr:minor head protein [Gordonia phage Jace]AWN03626.1 head assembly protein [Gordonia phage Jace]